ncbi:MAG: AAA family ATPase [Azonexus sp.]|nr:AAA family ATPase [Azonexus sp.]
MTSAIRQPGALMSGLVLRTTPPRAPRHQLLRPRLGVNAEAFRERPVMVVQAPAGFGKTSLLGQWRREHLARGAAVAWMSADDHEDPQHFLHALTLAVRIGCGRPAFGRYFLEGGGAPGGELEGITAWLAEVAQTSLDMVLIVDEVERLPARNFETLVYLLHNLPPNLRVIIAGRGELDDAVADLVAYGAAVAVGPDMLRFSLDETIAFVRNRFGGNVDTDACARLHEITEGWPLGLQLALAATEGAGDPRAAINGMLARNEGRSEQLVGGLLDNLAAGDVDFLVRVSLVELLHPDLCRALLDSADAPEQLARLARDTPIFMVDDDGEWFRLHALARDALRERLAELPAAELATLHLRAMAWLAERGMTQEAARHAHAAGQRQQAYDMAERCMYDAVTQGYHGTVLEWLEDLPESDLDSRPQLRLAAAWALALSERQEEAGRLVARILENPDVDSNLRYECALILSGAAYFADEPDRCAALFEPWSEAPPGREPRLLQMHANRQAILAILKGDPAQARRHLQQVVRGSVGKGHVYAGRWGEFFTGLSYIWEGQLLLGEETLRPALERAEADLGRRHPQACMLAALLAVAVYERDRLDEAAALLANRLDVLERFGAPETALFGYRTVARIAAAQGIEHRAIDLLEALGAVGVARGLPRMSIASLADQVRIHAGKFRSETCRVLADRIDEIVAQSGHPEGSLWHRSVALLQIISHANVAIAAQDWQAALDHLAPAVALADAMKLGRLRIEVMALRALALDRQGGNGRVLMLEAMNLAQTFGLARTFVDAHPVIADWMRRLVEEGGGGDLPAAVQVPRAVRPRPAREATLPRAVPSMVLTPKEREVLEFLARNLSNKEIAQAMSVGEETVKWHLKNLFGKLDAGTRKHVVRRAQLLGLLEGSE